MFRMEKLLALAAIGQKAYGKWLLQRIITGVVVMFGLTIVISIVIGATLVGGLYAGYMALLGAGLTAQTSIAIVIASALVAIGLMLLGMYLCIQHLRRVSGALRGGTSSVTSRVMSMFDAFTEGFTAEDQHPPRAANHR